MKLVKVSELFAVQYGTSLELNALTEVEVGGGVPFVSRSGANNGVSAMVAPVADVPPIRAGVLSVALGGSPLSTFLQEKPFYTGRDVSYLVPRAPMTRDEMLYYATCLQANRYRFSYGRQANRSLATLLIPALSEVPQWVGDGPIGQPGSLWHDLSTSQCLLAPASAEPLETKSWRRFRYDELFDIRKGKRLTSLDMTVGNTAFIGATEYSNGETGRIGQEALHPGGQISVSYNGSVAEAFYQPAPFWASDDVNVFYPRFEMSREVALFLVTLIRQEKYRYNYGRKWKLEKMRTSVFKLPATLGGTPDFAAMGAVVQGLPSWRLLEKLAEVPEVATHGNGQSSGNKYSTNG
jgi:hypothetical protein